MELRKSGQNLLKNGHFVEEKATVLSRRPPSRSSVEKKDEGLVAKRETELSLLPTPLDGVIHLVAEST